MMMGFLDLFRREKRDRNSARASDPYLAEFFGMGGANGFRSVEHSSRQAVAYACIRLIAETLASTPLKLRRYSEGGGSSAATDHPLYAVFQEQARPGLTAFAAREWLTASLLTHGNAFARIEHNGRGQVVALHPLAFGTVSVERLASGRLRYKVAGDRGTEVLLEDEMLHLRHRTRDGVMGLSPIAEARETFGLAMTQRDRAIGQTENGFNAIGALVFPNAMAPEQVSNAKKRFQDAYIGTANVGNKMMVLDGGAKFERFTISNKDTEFLDSQKKSDLDICRIFGVPPSAVGITDNATYSNIGEESRALVVRCLAPLARRIEEAMNASLLTAESRKTLFLEHDLAGLLRGDIAARYAAYRIGREAEFLSANDVRELENMSRIEGGDEYRSPSHRAAGEQTGAPE